MLSKVVADMEGWTRSGLAFGSVALNAAAPEFHQPGFTEAILLALSDASLPTSSLEIEVTESVLLETATDSVERALWRLHEAGVAIALDDFGTGYASLTHLKTFPVSWLKLDRTFVSNLEKDKDSAAIVRAVLNLARNIGIRVVAEGVETERQFQFLQRHRCDAAQGFLLSKPMAASRVPYFLSNWGRSPTRSPSPVRAV
jgi:EAL domain-containing protein (putative c-di-GMP-specific phosphodiesterase class I)